MRKRVMLCKSIKDKVNQDRFKWVASSEKIARPRFWQLKLINNLFRQKLNCKNIGRRTLILGDLNQLLTMIDSGLENVSNFVCVLLVVAIDFSDRFQLVCGFLCFFVFGLFSRRYSKFRFWKIFGAVAITEIDFRTCQFTRLEITNLDTSRVQSQIAFK